MEGGSFCVTSVDCSVRLQQGAPNHQCFAADSDQRQRQKLSLPTPHGLPGGGQRIEAQQGFSKHRAVGFDPVGSMLPVTFSRLQVKLGRAVKCPAPVREAVYQRESVAPGYAHSQHHQHGIGQDAP